MKHLMAILYEALRLYGLCFEDTMDHGLSIVLLISSWSRNGIGIDTDLSGETGSS